MKYRAEIDGLRAVAVVPVILFHAGCDLFSGGFVGVDIFFVISGYLITSIIIEDLENECFSIANFYERRARRILPALFLVMLAIIPFAVFMFTKDQLIGFAKSLISTSLFSSNVLFWSESGYFEANSLLKPLIHTWSLAVEEQYYLVFPLLLFGLWKFCRKKVFWVIFSIGVFSFLLSEWSSSNYPEANFFLLHTRAWELLAGSITALFIQKTNTEIKNINNILSLIGFIAVFYAIFAYDKTTPFPSVFALVPVLGTVFIIMFADKTTLVAKFLSIKLIVGIGLISYSAYLWHQPILTLLRLKLLEYDLPIYYRLLTLIGSLLIAYISWYFVEQPIRKRAILKQRKVLFISSVCVSFLFISIGVLIYKYPITFFKDTIINKPIQKTTRSNNKWTRCVQ